MWLGIDDMKIFFRIILFFILLFSCNDKYKVEKEAEKCFFSSFEDKESNLKEYVKQYESVLIDADVLKNSSEEAYFLVFKKILIKDFPRPIENFSLFDSINQLTSLNFVDININCNEKVKNFKGYNESTTHKIKDFMSSAKTKNLSNEEIMVGMYDTYPKDYFSIPIHKLQLLLLVDKLSKVKSY